MTLQDIDSMPFGKYAGRAMQRVPASYLDWLHGELAQPGKNLSVDKAAVLDYIERNRNCIDMELEKE